MKYLYTTGVVIFAGLIAIASGGCNVSVPTIFPSYNGPDSVASLPYHPKITIFVSDFIGNNATVFGSFNLKLLQGHDPFNGKPLGDPYYSPAGYKYGVTLVDGIKEKAVQNIQLTWAGDTSRYVSFIFTLDSLTAGTKYILRAYLKVPSDTTKFYGDTISFTQPGDPPGFTSLSGFPDSSFSGKVDFIFNGNIYMTSYSYPGTMLEYTPKTNLWKHLNSNANFWSTDIMTLYAATATIGYAYTTNSNLVEFNPVSGTWYNLWDDSLMGRSGIFFFSDGKYLYGGGGTNLFGGVQYPMDIWKYTPSPGTWKKLQPFPGKAHTWTNSVFVGGKAYLMSDVNGGSVAEFWEYDPTLDSWKQKTLPSLSFIFSIYDNCTPATDRFYLQNAGSIWSYTPATDMWLNVVTNPELIYNIYNPFAWVDGTIYFGLGDKGHYFWKYTP